MPPEAPAARRRWYALATIAFAASYALLPLYSSNQNHKFLTGLARAGEGWLRNDWLATTADPFPVFSAYVWFVHRYLIDAVHYAVYGLLLGAYVYGLMGITERVWPPDTRARTAERLVFLAALCLLHNEVVGYLIGVGVAQMPWWQMTHWGVAEQEIFGHSAFQPSSFGLLLPIALLWFLDGRGLRAAAVMAALVVIHSSYAITIGSLTLGFMVVEWRRTRALMQPLAVAAIVLAGALPVAAYVLVTFDPTSPEISRESASILVRHLPQETDPAVWFGLRAWLQVGLMVAGIILAAGTELLVPLGVLFLVGGSMTAVQIASGSDALAMLFPWRVSVLLVPIATALMVRCAVVRWRPARWAPVRAVAVSAIVVSMTAGVARMVLHFAYYNDYGPLTAPLDRVLPDRLRADFTRALGRDTLPMLDFVGRSVAEGDLYVIPPELERFRLRTGAPVLADEKSHPYKDREVLEWSRRMRLVRAFYATGDCQVLGEMADAYPVTHVVFDDRVRAARCNGLERVYSDATFDLFRLRRERRASGAGQ